MRIHPNTHCQICGRAIKNDEQRSGRIALHGYKRPHQGWQTRSCFGARHLPYEVSCEAIPLAIQAATNALERVQESLAKWRVEPPQTITYFAKQTWGKPDKSITIEKPEGFDPADVRGIGAYRSDSYRFQYDSVIYAWTQQIKEIEFDLEYLNKRLADWRAPQ